MPEDCDYVTDQNPAVFVHLAEKGLVPEYVMKSARVTPDEVGALSVVAFADTYKRLYPCHTKEACWESAAYYASQGNPETYVKDNIVKMAAAHGIEEDVNAVFSEFDTEFAAVKSASNTEVEPRYALALDFGGFQGRGEEEFYPIETIGNLLASADEATTDFQEHRLPMSAMRKVAYSIMDAANELGIHEDELPVNIRAFGVKRLPDPYTAQGLITMRKNAGVPIDGYSAILDMLGEQVIKAASADDAIDIADDAAERITELDAQNGIKYDSRMLNPYEILFTGPALDELNKAAASQVTIEGINVPVEDFLNLSDETISKSFSSGIAETIKSAKADVAGDTNIEKCASANEKMLTLSPDARKVLLAVLADTAW